LAAKLKIPCYFQATCGSPPRTGANTQRSAEFFRHYRFGKGLSYDATVWAFAARLAKLSWAMLRDGTHYDARRAFRAYLPAQIPA
jgi:hypothetical protein